MEPFNAARIGMWLGVVIIARPAALVGGALGPRAASNISRRERLSSVVGPPICKEPPQQTVTFVPQPSGGGSYTASVYYRSVPQCIRLERSR
jgi:hypothetical protein